MKVKIVIGLSILTIIIGGVVFGQAALEGRHIDRTEFAKEKLKVLSYSTFVSSFGPGPEIARRFKEKTGVEVELVNVGDSGLIVQKLSEDTGIYADVILGIDRLHQKEAETKLGWKPLPADWVSLLKPEISVTASNNFVPITWAPMTFLFQKSLKSKAKNLKELISESRSQVVSLQDPRLSTPGLQMLFWWDQQDRFSEGVNKSNIRVSPSWSQSYGLFKRKTAQMVFTYLTSIAFHWEAEKNFDYDFFVSEEGHPWQVELAGVSDRCRRCEDAQVFVRFLLEPENQTLLMKKNYMFPAVQGVSREGVFAKLPDVKLLSYEKLDQFLSHQEELENSFLETFQ